MNDPTENQIANALSLIEQGVGTYNPKMVVGLMSGGNDSIPACYIASLHPRFSGILHINTGIGVEQTREFVRELCADRGWKLWEYLASENTKADGTPDPQIYEDLCIRDGFPGPAMHKKMYARLKQRCLERFERDNQISSKTQSPVLYVTGGRKEESARRKMNIGDHPLHLDRERRRIWCNPIFNWTKTHCGNCRQYGCIKRNRVADDLGMSGECLCGAFAQPGELALIRFWFPDVAAHILRIESKVRAAGFPWGWEQGPPEWWLMMNEGQMDFWGNMEDDTPVEEQHLCLNCNKR
jgi:3'-phosphoadenosine 5'-phosphosulfate sulfotransferase (PAPS reductase)/FAD synthetase